MPAGLPWVSRRKRLRRACLSTLCPTATRPSASQGAAQDAPGATSGTTYGTLSISIAVSLTVISRAAANGARNASARIATENRYGISILRLIPRPSQETAEAVRKPFQDSRVEGGQCV